MIDIHCHLLPAIDDGAKDLDEALSLLRMSLADGVTRLVVTPHIHAGRFHNNKAIIDAALVKLKAAMDVENIELAIAAAAEVRIDAEILPMIEQDKIPFLGEYVGQKFLLLEMPHSHIPSGCDKLIKWLKSKDITPLIAHPERNRDILADPDKIKMFQRLGCWFQLTASSLTGGFGERCQQLSIKLLKEGVIDVVASDAHNIKRRPSILSHAYQQVSLLLNEESADKLFHRNPWNITQSLFVEHENNA
ncbi:MAG: capsule biosynthesis protein CapC [Alteromonadaceae bacterium]|nr:capsule biosynthesis protein CapC [Alteromonadaceae bacterium]